MAKRPLFSLADGWFSCIVVYWLDIVPINEYVTLKKAVLKVAKCFELFKLQADRQNGGESRSCCVRSIHTADLVVMVCRGSEHLHPAFSIYFI